MNSKELIKYSLQHFGCENKSFINIIEKNKDLINKNVFDLDDIKYKKEKLISPNGKSVLIHRWKGEFYYNLQGDDWGKFPSYKHTKTINEQKPYFLECLNSGANLTGCPIQNILLYFNTCIES